MCHWVRQPLCFDEKAAILRWIGNPTPALVPRTRCGNWCGRGFSIRTGAKWLLRRALVPAPSTNGEPRFEARGSRSSRRVRVGRASRAASFNMFLLGSDDWSGSSTRTLRGHREPRGSTVLFCGRRRDRVSAGAGANNKQMCRIWQMPPQACRGPSRVSQRPWNIRRDFPIRSVPQNRAIERRQGALHTLLAIPSRAPSSSGAID